MLTRVAQAAPRATGLAHLLRLGLNAVGATNTKISEVFPTQKKKNVSERRAIKIYFLYLLKSRFSCDSDADFSSLGNSCHHWKILS